MGTKNNPSKFDCYAKSEPDEPMFVLLARDYFAPMLVEIWAHMVTMHNEGIGQYDYNEKITEAYLVAENMRNWKENKNKPEIVDVEPIIIERLNFYLNQGDSAEQKFAKDLLNFITKHKEGKGLTIVSLCLCGHEMIAHNILQDFSFEGSKQMVAQAPEYRHCKECNCPKFQKPNM